MSPPRCLNHAFTVHTKYELAPPYPPFSPKVFLKLDGVVILNTGDSLIAISVDIEDNHAGFGFDIYSPRVARTVSSISSMGSPSEDQVSVDSHEKFVSEPEREHLDLLSGYIPTSPQNSNLTVYRNPPTPKDTTNIQSVSDHRPPQPLREKQLGKENQNIRETVLGRNMGSPTSSQQQSPGTDFMIPSPGGRQPADSTTASNRLTRSLDVYNFEGNCVTPKKEEDHTDIYGEHSPHSSAKISTVRNGLSHPEGARMQNNTPVNSDEICLPNSSMGSQPLQDVSDDSMFEKPHMLPSRHGPTLNCLHSPTGSTRPYGNLTLVSPPQTPQENFTLARGLCSPGHKYDTCSSTCSSCISTPLILQNDSKCFTYSVRRYVECYIEGQLEIEGTVRN